MTFRPRDYNQACKTSTLKSIQTMMTDKKLSSILFEELQRRKKKNPSYSLRSFARDLHLSRTTLSDVINNKQSLSHDNISRIAGILSMPFLLALQNRPAEPYYRLPASDELAMVTNWYYPALFSLARIKNNSASPDWISRRLGITPTQANKALRCLVNLGLVEIRADRMVPLKDGFETQTDIPSDAFRRYHRQNLRRALESLEKNSVEDRDILSLTLAFGEKDLKRAKVYVRKFINKFCKKFEMSNATDVYTLAVQLFPQTVRPASHSGV